MSTVKCVVEFGLPITAIGAAISGGGAARGTAVTAGRLSNGSWLSRSCRMVPSTLYRRSNPPLVVTQNKIAKQMFRV
jgi:hypothetical protein